MDSLELVSVAHTGRLIPHELFEGVKVSIVYSACDYSFHNYANTLLAHSTCCTGYFHKYTDSMLFVIWMWYYLQYTQNLDKNQHLSYIFL